MSSIKGEEMKSKNICKNCGAVDSIVYDCNEGDFYCKRCGDRT